MRRGFSIGEAVTAGLALAWRRPIAMLAWGLVSFLPTVFAVAPFWPLLSGAETLETFTRPTDLATMLQMNGVSMAGNAVSLLATAMVGGAVIRLVLEPRSREPTGLRLGLREGLYIVAQILITVGASVVLVVLAGLGVALGFALSGLGTAAAVSAGLLIPLAIIGVVAWLWARTGLISVISWETRRLALEDGWRAGRGRELRLFIMGLASVVLASIISALLMIVAIAPLWLLIQGTAAGDIDVWMSAPELAVAGVSPLAWVWFGVANLIGMYATGVFYAIAYAPWADAWRQLRSAPDANLTETS